MRGLSCSAREAVDVATCAARATSASVGGRSAATVELQQLVDDPGRRAEDGLPLVPHLRTGLRRDQHARLAVDRAKLAISVASARPAPTLASESAFEPMMR